jgi:serine phosphatase RsbU (regulator of sigma subunit)
VKVDVASRAPHARKYGATFAESWTSADGATIAAIGAVLAGRDPVVVSDLLRTGARALITSRGALAAALGALDRVVQRHAHEARDDELAAAVMFLALDPAHGDVELAGAGQLHAALIDGSGSARPLHGRAGALGTGIEPKDLVERIHLRRDDLLVVATVSIDYAWWSAGVRTADALLHRSAAREASAAIVSTSS